MSEHVHELMTRFMRADAFTGAAVLVAKNNRVVMEEYAGLAAPDVLVNARTLWPIASISKAYAAAMLMRLVELGALTLNLRVCDVLPEFRGAERETIRLRHLLTHTSGLIYESPEMEARLAAQTPLDELMQEALTAPLLFKPGTALRYADYNYLLAGYVAQVVMQTPYPQLVRSLVIEAMGLGETYLPPPQTEYARIAQVRGALANDTEGAMYNSVYARELAHPAFGVVATAADVIRFASHFAPGGPRIHAEKTVRAMTREQSGRVPGFHPTMNGYASDARMPWGFGFALQTVHVPAVFSELASFRTFGHGGASGCQLVIDPEPNLIVAVFTNTHLNTGREAWYARLQALVNCAFANVE